MKKFLVTINLFFLVNSIGAQTNQAGQKTESKPVSIGVSLNLPSALLAEERTINIYLPEEYSSDSATTYPVIYLLDGGVAEDFIHIVGLVRYNTTPWVNRFPKSIVVGIENTNRRRDFTFATPNLDFLSKIGFDKSSFPAYGGSEKFIAFIEQELQPFIRQKYKTNSSKTIIGESLGGLLATEILLTKPGLFDTYIIISPSLWWGAEKLLTLPIQKTLITNTKIYIGASNQAEDTMMFRVAERLANNIKRSAGSKTKIIFDHLQNESHATIIHPAVYNAFSKLFKENK